VITIPVMIVLFGTILYIFNTVGKLTGLELEDMMKQKPKPKKRRGDTDKADSLEEPRDNVVGEHQSPVR